MAAETLTEAQALLKNMEDTHPQGAILAARARALVETGFFELYWFDYAATPVIRSQSPLADQFGKFVRNRFFKKTAHQCTRTLTDTGVDEVGLAFMRLGRAPYNARGEKYRLRIDHIIDMQGSWEKGWAQDEAGVYQCN